MSDSISFINFYFVFKKWKLCEVRTVARWYSNSPFLHFVIFHSHSFYFLPFITILLLPSSRTSSPFSLPLFFTFFFLSGCNQYILSFSESFSIFFCLFFINIFTVSFLPVFFSPFIHSFHILSSSFRFLCK